VEGESGWTDEAVETAKRLWLDGQSAGRISAQLGRGLSRNAVIGKMYRLGLAGRAKSARQAAPPVTLPAPEVRVRLRRDGAPSRPHAGDIVRVAAARAERQHVHPGEIVRAVAARALDPGLASDADEPPPDGGITIVELTARTCRWPLGDPSEFDDFRFCGAAKTPDLGPYCAYHARLAYRPALSRERESADG